MNAGQPRLQQSCDDLFAILRLLPPVSMDPDSLSIFSGSYNPVISDGELIRLGIRFDHLDIETGDVSSPAIPCFLPRTNFPDISEVLQQDHASNDVFECADEAGANRQGSPDLFKGRLDIFPDGLILAFDKYSFEGSEDLEMEDRDNDRQLIRYGWVTDYETWKRVDYSNRQHDDCHNQENVSDDVEFEMRHNGRHWIVNGWVIDDESDSDSRHDACQNQRKLRALNMAEVGTCGDNSRPSRDEVAALACAMLDSMWCESLSINNERPHKDNDLFPTLLIVFDEYGHSRVLTGYYEGQLCIQFTDIFDFKEYADVPPHGTPYLDSIDKDKFYKMMNILLKWSWPIPVLTKFREDSTVVLDLPIHNHPNTQVVDDGWLFV
ncbi:uncharacterized protein N7482_001195 [Penicillium canariense]|uniref:Uncharacterized protein n=1 Tax=Penicillium canariense TaxID=189055 RepID=A0A9W9IEN0_9EURO|nr:uncharacterized protein N7482_001195 [Penicillium canariense]KAJ5175318.1 hypothetical protein N7482_001195 [Penicillium canariense]